MTMRKMKRLLKIEIESCKKCPYCREGVAIRWCARKVENILDAGIIPDFCPLPIVDSPHTEITYRDGTVEIEKEERNV